MELQGKVAVVTGAASGIGLAAAERFVAEGMSVVMADIEGCSPSRFRSGDVRRCAFALQQCRSRRNWEANVEDKTSCVGVGDWC